MTKILSHIGSLPANLLLVILALVVASLPLILSEQLMNRMEQEERLKIQTWAKATESIASESGDALNDLALQIIESNTTIPLILTSAEDDIIGYKNLNEDKVAKDSTYLSSELQRFKSGYPPIVIDLGGAGKQYLYYNDSSTLRQLLRFPYLQTGVFMIYIIILVITIHSMRRWEQDRIWVGLSKETAHQLGTPISSLMAWIELLKEYNLPTEVIDHMAQDIGRLGLIAHRFQKIGSQPELQPTDLNAQIEQGVIYLSQRISKQVEISFRPATEPLICNITADLMNWVVENMVKNAVDAMDGKGQISIVVKQRGRQACIDVSDTGKGMTRHTQRMIFKPGFTTKKRGWGLGLSLVRRIIQDYFKGRIYVKHSELQVGTTFRIILPLYEIEA